MENQKFEGITKSARHMWKKKGRVLEAIDTEE